MTMQREYDPAEVVRYRRTIARAHAVLHGTNDTGPRRARTILAFAAGAAPREAPLWRCGENPTDYGVHLWTERSAAEVMAHYQTRGNLLPISIEHCGEDCQDQQGVADLKCVGGGYARLEIRAGRPWLVFAWSKPAMELIERKEKLFLSPYYMVDKDTEEILAVLSVSLVANPGTHYAQPLSL